MKLDGSSSVECGIHTEVKTHPIVTCTPVHTMHVMGVTWDMSTHNLLAGRSFLPTVPEL